MLRVRVLFSRSITERAWFAAISAPIALVVFVNLLAGLPRAVALPANVFTTCAFFPMVVLPVWRDRICHRVRDGLWHTDVRRRTESFLIACLFEQCTERGDRRHQLVTAVWSARELSYPLSPFVTRSRGEFDPHDAVCVMAHPCALSALRVTHVVRGLPLTIGVLLAEVAELAATLGSENRAELARQLAESWQGSVSELLQAVDAVSI